MKTQNFLLICLVGLPILGILAINVEVGDPNWLTLLIFLEITVFITGFFIGSLMAKVYMYEKKCETETKVEF